MEPTPSRRT